MRQWIAPGVPMLQDRSVGKCQLAKVSADERRPPTGTIDDQAGACDSAHVMYRIARSEWSDHVGSLQSRPESCAGTGIATPSVMFNT